MLSFRNLQQRWNGYVYARLEKTEVSFQSGTCARHWEKKRLSVGVVGLGWVAFQHLFEGDISQLLSKTAFFVQETKSLKANKMAAKEERAVYLLTAFANKIKDALPSKKAHVIQHFIG